MAEAVVEVEHGLRRELRLRDLVPMQIMLLVGVTWSGIAAKRGSGHPVLWIFGILLFFLPQVVVVSYCASNGHSKAESISGPNLPLARRRRS